MLPRVPPDYRLLADARIKLADFKPGVEGAVAKVPPQLRNDPGLLYERTRWRRRKELYDSALESLLNPPKDLVRPVAWWAERQILARRALGDGKPQPRLSAHRQAWSERRYRLRRCRVPRRMDRLALAA